MAACARARTSFVAASINARGSTGERQSLAAGDPETTYAKTEDKVSDRVGRFLVRVVITAVVVLVMSEQAPGLVQVEENSLTAALVFAFVLGVLNAFLRPIILLLTLPLTLLTLGLFTLVINALVFWIATWFPVGVHVPGFGAAFVDALLVSVVSFVASRALK